MGVYFWLLVFRVGFLGLFFFGAFWYLNLSLTSFVSCLFTIFTAFCSFLFLWLVVLSLIKPGLSSEFQLLSGATSCSADFFLADERQDDQTKRQDQGSKKRTTTAKGRNNTRTLHRDQNVESLAWTALANVCVDVADICMNDATPILKWEGSTIHPYVGNR